VIGKGRELEGVFVEVEAVLPINSEVEKRSFATALRVACERLF
jgi:hypothetical protein